MAALLIQLKILKKNTGYSDSYVENLVPTKPPKPDTAPTLSFQTNGGFSITSLTVGSTSHLNRSYNITNVHADYMGAYWYKTNQDSNYVNPTFNFTQATRLYFITTHTIKSQELISQGFQTIDESEEDIITASNSPYQIQIYKDFEAGSHQIDLFWSQAGFIIIVN